MTRRDDRVGRRNTPVDARAHFVVHLLSKQSAAPWSAGWLNWRRQGKKL
jgi:hypothetical protein